MIPKGLKGGASAEADSAQDVAAWPELAVVLALASAISGVGLLFFFRPVAEQATDSVIDLHQATPFGAFRDVHAWTSHGLLLLGFCILARAFVLGHDAQRRRWGALVAGLVLLVAAATSGVSLLHHPSTALHALHVAVLPFAGLALVAWARGAD